MHIEKMQTVLSIMIVAAFLLGTGAIAIYPVLAGKPLAEYTEHLQTYTSLYSGALGLIVGFVFGKRTADAQEIQE
jgi:hypothetical protein